MFHSEAEFYVMPLIIHSVALLLVAQDVVFSLVFIQSLIGLGMSQKRKGDKI